MSQDALMTQAKDLADYSNDPDPTEAELAAAEAESQKAVTDAAAEEATDKAAADQAAADKAAADKAAADKAAAEAAAQADAAQKTVPLATHVQERDRLKAEIRELKQVQEKYGGLEKEIADLKAKLAANEKKAPPDPDFVADPKGYIDHNVKSMAEKIREMEAKGKASDEQLSQREQIAQAERAIKTAVDSFAEKTPDFNAALEFARTARIAELRDMYPEATEEQLKSSLAVEEFRTAVTMISQKRNPGEFIYGWAKRRGYTPEQKQDAKTGVTDEQKAEMASKRDKAEGLGSGGRDQAIESDALEPENDEFDLAMKEAFKR